VSPAKAGVRDFICCERTCSTFTLNCSATRLLSDWVSIFTRSGVRWTLRLRKARKEAWLTVLEAEVHIGAGRNRLRICGHEC
jgi:hypothetical protein